MKKLLVLFAVILALVANVPVFAQATSGSVSGAVTDDTGAALPGVTVELSGPAMQGTRTAVTDGAGNYTFRNIPPGSGYRISANLSGFATVTKTDLRVFLGQDAHVDLQLRAAVTESITVTAEAPLVDVTRTTTGTNVTASQFESLPTARSFQQLTTLAPGVTMEMGDTRGQLANSPNVGASSAPENNYIIDGLSTTDARYGTSGTNLTMNFVEEVQVMTGGYSAEYGRSTGGVFNVITKSGGNEFHGDLFGYYRDANWASDAVRSASHGIEYGYNNSDSMDVGLSLGGPIMRDRLWFFAAYDPSRRTTYIGDVTLDDGSLYTDPTEFDTDTDFYAGKLTWALNPNHNIAFSAFGDPTTREGWTGPTFGTVDTSTRVEEIGSTNMSLRYTGIITPSFLVEANLGRHEKENKRHAMTEIGRTVPQQIDYNTGETHGGNPRIVDDSSGRDSYALKLSNFFGGHELRYGVDMEQNEYTTNLDETWYWAYDHVVTSCDAPGHLPPPGCLPGPTADRIRFGLQERHYLVNGTGETDNNAIFLQDQWKVLPNLTLNLGLRYEEQELTSTRGVFTAGSADQINTGDYAHADSFKLDGNWAPRLGIVWDPMNNGRSKIYAFGGRFYEAIPLDINIRALNGEDYIIKYYYTDDPNINVGNFYNPVGSPFDVAEYHLYRNRNLTQATATPLDEDLKAQYQDEYILGGEYQFGAAWSAGIRFVDRELGRVIEDFGTFTDPEDPTALTGYAIGNPGEGNFGAPYAAPERYYRAAELTLQRARLNNWQLTSSFVYAQSEGNYEGLYMSGYEQLDPNITALYDIPSFLVNANGKLRADKPYQFKVHSSYTFPFGLTIGEGFNFSAGIPTSANGPETYNGYGDGTIFLLERGSQERTPDYWSLDLHLDYALPFFSGGSRGLSAILDVFNVTDNDETLEVDQDMVFDGMEGIELWNTDDFGNPVFTQGAPVSPYYQTPILFQAPRSVQVGLKFTY